MTWLDVFHLCLGLGSAGIAVFLRFRVRYWQREAEYWQTLYSKELVASLVTTFAGIYLGKKFASHLLGPDKTEWPEMIEDAEGKGE